MRLRIGREKEKKAKSVKGDAGGDFATVEFFLKRQFVRRSACDTAGWTTTWCRPMLRLLELTGKGQVPTNV